MVVPTAYKVEPYALPQTVVFPCLSNSGQVSLVSLNVSPTTMQSEISLRVNDYGVNYHLKCRIVSQHLKMRSAGRSRRSQISL